MGDQISIVRSSSRVIGRASMNFNYERNERLKSEISQRLKSGGLGPSANLMIMQWGSVRGEKGSGSD
jgi:hypothetical protein